MVVRVAVHSCVVMVASASSLTLKSEIPRGTGNSFSYLATRIPRHLLSILLGKSFMSSKQFPYEGEFPLSIGHMAVEICNGELFIGQGR